MMENQNTFDMTENIPDEMFEIIGLEKDEEVPARPRIGYWADAWRRFKENKVALLAGIILLVLIFFIIFGPAISGYGYEKIDSGAINQGPSAAHWFGTDDLGRDLFARVWQAGRVSFDWYYRSACSQFDRKYLWRYRSIFWRNCGRYHDAYCRGSFKYSISFDCYPDFCSDGQQESWNDADCLDTDRMVWNCQTGAWTDASAEITGICPCSKCTRCIADENYYETYDSKYTRYDYRSYYI